MGGGGSHVLVILFIDVRERDQELLDMAEHDCYFGAYVLTF